MVRASSTEGSEPGSCCPGHFDLLTHSGAGETGRQISGFESCLCPYQSPRTIPYPFRYLSGPICGEGTMTLFALPMTICRVFRTVTSYF